MDGSTSPVAWRALLVGGNSGAGKTVAVRAIAQHLGVSVLLVDDVRLALQEMTAAEQQPDLHAFLGYGPEGWHNAEGIRDDWIRVGRAMARPLKVIVAHHVVVSGAGPVIIEGDGILPEIAAQSDYAELRHFYGLKTGHEVRGVFVVETDEERLLANLRARGRGFETWDASTQAAFGHASRLYGEWLSAQAEAHGLPVLQAQPYETLAERITSAAGRFSD